MVFAMLDSDMFPSNGELIELIQRQRTVQRAPGVLCAAPNSRTSRIPPGCYRAAMDEGCDRRLRLVSRGQTQEQNVRPSCVRSAIIFPCVGVTDYRGESR